MQEQSKSELLEYPARISQRTIRLLARGAIAGAKESVGIGWEVGKQVLRKAGLAGDGYPAPDQHATRQQLIENELAEHGQRLLRQREYERIDVMFLQLVRIIRRRSEEPQPITEHIQDAAFVLQAKGIDEPTIGVAVSKAHDWAAEANLLKDAPGTDVALPSMTHVQPDTPQR